MGYAVMGPRNSNELIVNHIYGDAHKAVVNSDECKKLWFDHSGKHPCIKVLKDHEADVIS